MQNKTSERKFKKIPELPKLFGVFYMNLEKPLNDEKYTPEEKSKQLMACFYATIEALYRKQTALFLNELLRINLQSKFKEGERIIQEVELSPSFKEMNKRLKNEIEIRFNNQFTNTF